MTQFCIHTPVALVIRHDRQYRPKQSGLNCLVETIPTFLFLLTLSQQVGSVQHVFHHVVIKVRQLFLRPAACLTSTLLETGVVLSFRDRTPSALTTRPSSSSHTIETIPTLRLINIYAPKLCLFSN
jgi:hypothetical protein